MPVSSTAAARPRPLGFIRPLLPTLVEAPPTGDGWLHEIKHDGYRTMLVVEGGNARAFTKNGHDWTDRYGRIVEAAAKLACTSAIVDGEMVVQDERGIVDFSALRGAIAAEPHRLVFYAFDLLHLDGRDLRLAPLEERRALLKELAGEPDAHGAIQVSEALAGDGPTIFAAAEQLGVEGIVSKRLGSCYSSGESQAWLKTKCIVEGEFVVVGMAPNPGGPPYALLAREEENGLAYVGSAFVTLPQPARDAFWTRTEAMKIPRPVLKELKGKKASFVRPELKMRVRYLRGEGDLRHAFVAGISS